MLNIINGKTETFFVQIRALRWYRLTDTITYVKCQEFCIPLYRRMRQMDKDGKKMVAEFVYWHAV